MNYTAVVRNGKLIPNEPVYFQDEIAKYEGKEIEVTIKSNRKRSNGQNRYYWGVVVYLVRERLNELGYVRSDLQEGTLPSTLTREDVHVYLRENFNRKDIVNAETGEVLGASSVSTSELSTEEFGEYLERIMSWSSMYLDLMIPPAEVQISYNK